MVSVETPSENSAHTPNLFTIVWVINHQDLYIVYYIELAKLFTLLSLTSLKMSLRRLSVLSASKNDILF